jgi:hypothetical protein
MEIQSLLGVIDTAPICRPALTNGSFAGLLCSTHDCNVYSYSTDIDVFFEFSLHFTGEYVRKIGLISCSKHIPCQQIQSTVVERRFSFPLPRPVSCKATFTKGTISALFFYCKLNECHSPFEMPHPCLPL